MNNKKTALISAVSGMLTGVTYIFDNLYFLVFVSIAPAVLCILNNNRTIFTAMFYFFFSFYAFADLWFFSVGLSFMSSETAGFFLSLVLLLAVSLILAFTASVPFWLMKNICFKNPFLFSAVFSFIFIFSEWLHGIFPVNFSWNRLCNIIACDSRLIQLASVFGGLSVSFIIILINVCNAYFIKFLIRKDFHFTVPLCFSAVIFVLNIFLGNKVSDYYSFTTASPHEIMLAQGDYSVQEKRNMPPEQILSEYINLSQKSLTPQTELVVFPETAVSERFFHDSIYNRSLYEFAEKNEISILFGCSYKKDDKKYNSCLILSPDGRLSDIYRKRQLVPFGEYTPSFLPQNIHFLKSTYCKGEENIIVESDIGKIGCCICFESVFPSVSAENTTQGAELLAILSNDAWLGRSVPLYQHHSHSIMRAVENRKYTVTCANTGISSVISPNGDIVAVSEKNRIQTVSAKVFTNNVKTFYSKHGDIIIIPSVLIVSILFIIKIIVTIVSVKYT